MIANSFELQKDRSHDQSPQRNFHLNSALNGLTESCSMRKTRVPGDALRAKHSFRYGQLLKEFFRALMGIEHSQLQIEERITGYRVMEMAGLDGFRMNGAYRKLKDAY